MNGDERGPWYLLTGLIIGVALGLLYAWVLKPVVYEKTSPTSLGVEYKAQYRALIAAAYAADGNLPRAQARLGLLSDQDAASAVAAQAQNWLADKRPEAVALGMLAAALGQGTAPVVLASQGRATSSISPVTSTPQPSATLTITPVPATATTPASAQPGETSAVTPPPLVLTPQGTLAPTITPLPTRTATPTQGAPFYLKDIRPVCDVTLKEPLIMVEAYDAAEKPVPGVEVVVQWETGEDHFYTGLKPELGLGYADFLMKPQVSYTLHLAVGGKPIPGIISNECEAPSRDRFWGSWKLVFAQP